MRDDGHTLVLTIPLLPPSKNEVRKISPSVRHHVLGRLRESARELIRMCLLQVSITGEVRRATVKRKVTFAQFRARELDVGNQEEGMVPVQDALVLLGLLRDDSQEWADITYLPTVGGVPKRHRRLEITIESVEQ